MSDIAIAIVVICATAGVIGLSWITAIAQLDSFRGPDPDGREGKKPDDFR
jgi:hypothetical protein